MEADTTTPEKTKVLSVRTPKNAPTPRPFLKWVGGKGQLLPELRKHVPSSFNAYHEPFVGGGAMFFDLARSGAFAQTLHRAHLSDTNELLVRTYRAVRDGLDTVVDAGPSLAAQLALLQENGNTEAVFAYMKDAQVASPRLETREDAYVAAWMIYINKTCFNGLFRVNSKGAFNVGFGAYKNPQIFDEENLRACGDALQHAFADLRCQHWSEALRDVAPGDFVYADPPYLPAQKGGFVSYGARRFGVDDHADLAERLRFLKEQGVHVLVSQSDDPRIRELYPEGVFSLHRVEARRNVNSKGSGRGPVGELIIT